MTKSELQHKLAYRFGRLSTRKMEIVVDNILELMTEALREGRRIEIRGFGSFSIRNRPAKIARNPMSGEAVQVPAKRIPHFKPGKLMRQNVKL